MRQRRIGSESDVIIAVGTAITLVLAMTLGWLLYDSLHGYMISAGVIVRDLFVCAPISAVCGQRIYVWRTYQFIEEEGTDAFVHRDLTGQPK